MANAKRIVSNARTSDRSKGRGIVSWIDLARKPNFRTDAVQMREELKL